MAVITLMIKYQPCIWFIVERVRLRFWRSRLLTLDELLAKKQTKRTLTRESVLTFIRLYFEGLSLWYDYPKPFATAYHRRWTSLITRRLCWNHSRLRFEWKLDAFEVCTSRSMRWPLLHPCYTDTRPSGEMTLWYWYSSWHNFRSKMSSYVRVTPRGSFRMRKEIWKASRIHIFSLMPMPPR